MVDWIKDGEEAKPEVLERPLLTHSHRWGELYQNHLSENDPHGVKELFSEVFLKKHYWYTHPEVYSALLQLGTAHITDFNAHPEIWGPLLEAFDRHTHPSPQPLVELVTDSPQVGQLYVTPDGNEFGFASPVGRLPILRRGEEGGGYRLSDWVARLPIQISGTAQAEVVFDLPPQLYFEEKWGAVIPILWSDIPQDATELTLTLRGEEGILPWSGHVAVIVQDCPKRFEAVNVNIQRAFHPRVIILFDDSDCS